MIIGRGAEAILEKKDGKLYKIRIKKNYRIEQIDDFLRKSRTKKELKLLLEARRNGVDVPTVFESDAKEVLIMEFIDGKPLRDILNKLKPKELKEICTQIGQAVAKLHSAGIIHGDLTTSNMILHNNKVYFIDFGLGTFSNKIEDKAVDLHLLREALISKHNKIWQKCFKLIIDAYKANIKESKEILHRVEQIEKRGRYARKD